MAPPTPDAPAHDGRPYVIPDFEADEALKAEYQRVLREVSAAAIARGLKEVRDEFAELRRTMGEAARSAQAAQARAEREEHEARVRYSRVVPKDRTASGMVQPPTLFFDLILTMGAAEKFYKEVVRTAKQRRETTEAARVAFAALDRLKTREDQLLVQRELEIRRHLKTAEGKAELDKHERLAPIAERLAAIDAERASYQERLAAKTVSDEEQRDRTMAQEGLRYLDGDVRGLHCLREDLRFGNLRYMSFRDRRGCFWLLDYRQEFRPLINTTFDVNYTPEQRYVVGRSVNDGGPARERMHARLPGPDPRAGLGVDPDLLRAIADFVYRERTAT